MKEKYLHKKLSSCSSLPVLLVKHTNVDFCPTHRHVYNQEFITFPLNLNLKLTTKLTLHAHQHTLQIQYCSLYSIQDDLYNANNPCLRHCLLQELEVKFKLYTICIQIAPKSKARTHNILHSQQA